ncbi:MAG: OprO/OprP family phosphate-selective porin [Vicinamibacteria bacterium]|nr:OprO/OprP family phosphate-selective porin [Vicinamibacteria bacterium]
MRRTWPVLVVSFCILGGAPGALAQDPQPSPTPEIPRTPPPRKLWESEEGGLFLLNRVQGRFTHTMPDDSVRLSGMETGESKGEFKIRRAKTEITGWVWKKELTFELQLSWAGPEPGASTQSALEDLVLNWDASKKGTFEIAFGQFKVPLGRQEMTSSGRLQFLDRDILTYEFTRGRDIGVQFGGRLAEGRLQYLAGIFNGNAASRAGNDNGKYQYNARLVFEPWGSVGYSEGDFESTDRPLLAIAGQFEHNDQLRAGSSLSNVFEYKTVIWGADAVFKYRGFSAFAEVFARERQPLSGASFASDGWHAQAGYFLVRDRFEAAVRYATWDPTEVVDEDDQVEKGVALSYFFRKHGLKLQGDFRQLEDKQDETKTEELRLQLQVMF